MSLKAYLSFVELPTKIASVIPFIMGVIYTHYRYGQFNFTNIVVMFISMITFDMATTAINNYCDYKNELKHFKDDYKGRNAMFVYNISQKKALCTIAILLFTATIFGIILTFRTNLLVLAVGVVCFFVGIFYTFGPIPISRMPLGEVFSGGFMGLLIPFLTIYISIYNKDYFGIYIDNTTLLMKFNLVEMLVIGTVSIPLIGGIANIMLANNICDLEEDIKVGRYTLPYYISKKVAVKLYKYIYYVGYITILLSVVIDILPKTALLSMLTLYIVQKNIEVFEKEQIKSKTFVTSVKNFSILGISYIVSILISLV
ncbi:1,4-dihydroxy-2-naphthoate polyprenyltransferase [Romboutsia sp.]|uniref:1,4-dihydroxy-2-naphthoate polyprenyltransferase n=1 Tax=Romboutsia sp. TaxID=1965302 RepID=UPI003F33463D